MIEEKSGSSFVEEVLKNLFGKFEELVPKISP